MARYVYNNNTVKMVPADSKFSCSALYTPLVCVILSYTSFVKVSQGLL